MSANNLKAAREVVRSRANFANRPQRASSAGITKPLSIRAATVKYKASSSSAVDRLVKQLENPDSVRPAGRPRSLTDEEEEAIVAFVMWMEKSGFPASKPEIEDAANTLRRRRDPEAKPVGHSWYSRFCEDHPELQKTFLKAVEKSRESWEAGGIADLKNWFERLAEAIRTFRIGASECWNADQAGIRVGCLRERVQCLVVRTRRKTRAQVLDPSNRETATLIGTGSAAGDTTPPWIIFKTLPTLDYAYVDANPQMRLDDEGNIYDEQGNVVSKLNKPPSGGASKDKESGKGGQSSLVIPNLLQRPDQTSYT